MSLLLGVFVDVWYSPMITYNQAATKIQKRRRHHKFDIVCFFLILILGFACSMLYEQFRANSFVCLLSYSFSSPRSRLSHSLHHTLIIVSCTIIKFPQIPFNVVYVIRRLYCFRHLITLIELIWFNWRHWHRMRKIVHLIFASWQPLAWRHLKPWNHDFCNESKKEAFVQFDFVNSSLSNSVVDKCVKDFIYKDYFVVRHINVRR